MMTISRNFTNAMRSPQVNRNVFAISRINFCTAEKIEKADELKLSYLTGQQKGIAVVELNREQGKNSLNKSLVSKLLNSIDVLGHDKNVRVVIIR